MGRTWKERQEVATARKLEVSCETTDAVQVNTVKQGCINTFVDSFTGARS